ncbi:MAG TPA: glycosyltransferase family 9 protein [Dongiaceae bacterium]|nr:glycosyltransferase family 9 protein [Dongiaceae bacterium]
MADPMTRAWGVAGGALRWADRKAPPQAAALRRILVCATGGLGNAILLQPLLLTLRAGCPGARIDLLVTSGAAAAFLEMAGWADRVLRMPEHEWYGGAANFRRFGGPLRRERYDAVLRTFLTSPCAKRSSLAAALSRAPIRVAFGTRPTNPFETHLLVEDPAQPETERHLALARALGLEPAWSFRPTPAPASGIAWSDAFLKEHGVADGRALLGLHPGSDPRYTAKRWPAARFGALAAQASRRLAAQPVIFGGPDDREVVRGALDASERTAIAAADQDIAGTAALIARCRAFVTNDSGLMHLASLMGVPTLALFGPSDPVKNRTVGQQPRVVRLGLACSPCSKTHAMSACEHHDCLRTLETARVFESLATLWRETAGATAAAAAGRS